MYLRSFHFTCLKQKSPKNSKGPCGVRENKQDQKVSAFQVLLSELLCGLDLSESLNGMCFLL